MGADKDGMTLKKMREISAEKVRIQQEHIVVRLGDELDRLIRIGAWLRGKLEEDLQMAIGKGLPRDTIRAYKELATTIESVVSAKVRFDKAAKQMADNMTPAEERKAVVTYLKACNAEDRKEILRDVKDWENGAYGINRKKDSPVGSESDSGQLAKVVEDEQVRGDNPEPLVLPDPANDD